MGKLDGGWVVASESCAFDLVGAEFIRDVKPGEMLVFEDDYAEPKSMMWSKEMPSKCAHCNQFMISHDQNSKSTFDFINCFRTRSSTFSFRERAIRLKTTSVSTVV